MAPNYSINKIKTSAFEGQKPGTSGLRKPTRTFLIEKYTENFIQSILSSFQAENSTLIVGGDGRFFIQEAIDKIIKIAAGNKVSKLIIGQNGILSTPAVSNLIRKYETDGGIILTASHNPGGIDEDFGIKFNVSNGGPAPDNITLKIFEISKEIKEYSITENIPIIDLNKIGIHEFQVENKPFTVQIIDSVSDYLTLMKEIFDFNFLKKFLANFPILINSMNGVTGPYVKRIFGDELNCKNLVNITPLPDFGGLHPDPNLTYAKDLMLSMKANISLEFGTAYDGDGDRNMIIGKEGFFLNPCDTLAIIGANLLCIPYFKNKGQINGFARSMPTSGAIDKVAEKLGLSSYQVPTGWKYFGNLMDTNKIELCGEESFGTGSNHIREKDGIWTTLAVLSILAHKKQSIQELIESHWTTFGRNYFSRLDYEGLDSLKAENLLKSLEELLTGSAGDIGVDYETADNYQYTDPVDGSLTKNQGLRLLLKDGSRIVWRLSGTGSSGATLRVYLEKYETNWNMCVNDVLSPVKKIFLELTKLKEAIGTEEPTVIT